MAPVQLCSPSLYSDCHRLHLYPSMPQTQIYIIVLLEQIRNCCFSSCLLNCIEKNGVTNQKYMNIAFIFIYIIIFTSILFLHVDLSYCLVFLPFSMKDSLEHFLQNKSSSSELSIFVYLEFVNFAFIFEEQFY